MIHSFDRHGASPLRGAPVTSKAEEWYPTPAPTPGSPLGGFQLRPPTAPDFPTQTHTPGSSRFPRGAGGGGSKPPRWGEMGCRAAGMSGAHGMRGRRAVKGTAGWERSPAGEGGPQGSGAPEGRVSAPPPLPAAHQVPCVPRAASYLVAPGSGIGDPEPRGSHQPPLLLAPPPPAPPCRGARGRGSAHGRGRSAGPEGWSAAPQAPLAGPAQRPRLPVDTCSAENPILQTLIESPASARHCARGWSFKAKRGREAVLGH